MTIQAGVITVSDKGSQGTREDKSGPEIVKILEGIGAVVRHRAIIPDEIDQITKTLIDFADHKRGCRKRRKGSEDEGEQTEAQETGEPPRFRHGHKNGG